MSRGAITGALLFDGGGADPRPATTVVWEDARIVWVGPDADADLAGATAVDAGGGALLPGLFDSHVHLCLEPTAAGVENVVTEATATLAIRSASAAKRLLDAGVTTARDMGSREGVAIEVATAQRSGWMIGTRVLAAGRGITPPGGHGWMIGVEAKGPDAVRAAVRAEIERGADVVKIFPTGGVLGSGAHGFAVTMSQDEVGAAVAEAHAHGRLIGAHVHGPEGVDLVLDAGVDTVEHGTGVTAEQATRMAGAGVALVPTLAAIDAIARHEAELPAALVARAREVLEVAADGVRRAIAAGVTVLAGTDAGTPFNPPGGLVREMELLADLGLGRAGVLRAATSQAAAALGQDGRGVVAADQLADLVLVTDNPLEGLRALATPRIVIQDGKMRVLSGAGGSPAA